jgi:hypothetical protein
MYEMKMPGLLLRRAGAHLNAGRTLNQNIQPDSACHRNASHPSPPSTRAGGTYHCFLHPTLHAPRGPPTPARIDKKSLSAPQ